MARKRRDLGALEMTKLSTLPIISPTSRITMSCAFLASAARAAIRDLVTISVSPISVTRSPGPRTSVAPILSRIGVQPVGAQHPHGGHGYEEVDGLSGRDPAAEIGRRELHARDADPYDPPTVGAGQRPSIPIDHRERHQPT